MDCRNGHVGNPFFFHPRWITLSNIDLVVNSNPSGEESHKKDCCPY